MQFTPNHLRPDLSGKRFGAEAEKLWERRADKGAQKIIKKIIIKNLQKMATKIKRKYKNAATVDIQLYKGEVNTGESKTVPDQAMTVREIIRRTQAGTLPDLGTGGMFTEDLPDLRGYDIADLKNMADEAKQNANELHQQYEDGKKAAKAKKELPPVEPLNPE